MAKKTVQILPATQDILNTMGEQIKQARLRDMIFAGSFRAVFGQFSCSIEAQKYTENILNVH